jgi:alkylation response protein AidB-like acyl-CoA dehydrogenase
VSFVTNRRDLDFLLFELFALDRVLEAARYAAWDRTSISGVFDVAQNIAENHFLPCAARLDANEPRFVDGRVEIIPEVRTALAACAEAGLFGAGFDEADGGLQAPTVVTALVQGMLSAANVSVANYQFLTIGNANMLSSFGSAEQKARFLPAMLAGKWFGTMCLSEPQAGSSLSDIRMRAEPVGDGQYRLTGTKMWISGGDHELSENIVHMVLARLPDAPPGVKGISLFLVPKYRVADDGTPGAFNNIALAGLNHKLGQRGTTNCLLNFGESGETLGTLVGEPNMGLAHMFHMMNEARISVGTSSVMTGLAGYLYSLDYARTRLQGRPIRNKDPQSAQVPIIDHADVKRMLLAQKAAVEGALALVTFCALLVDERSIAEDEEQRAELTLLLDLLTPVAKSWPSEHCLEANKLAIQILGGYGYTRDYPVERLYRDNRLNHIHEGTFGIQGIDLLGRKVRSENGRALDLLAARIGETLREAEARTALSAKAVALQQALARLQEATRTAIACDDIEVGLANATLYLDAFGHVVVAWLWLMQAVRSSVALKSGTADRHFYTGKLAACRYFFRYELPDALAKLTVVESLDDVCVTIAAEEFTGV